MELIYGNELNPLFDFMLIMWYLWNTNMVQNTYDHFYDNYFLVRKSQKLIKWKTKALMKSACCFMHWQSEKAWEYKKRNRFKTTKHSKKSTYYLRNHVKRNKKNKTFHQKMKLIYNMSATENEKPSGATDTNFDTDSYLIGVDNRTSFCMTNSAEDYVTAIRKAPNVFVRGVGGSLISVNGVGTVKWCITDDEGMNHEFIIPNVYLIKDLDIRLLSPQHWAQAADDNYPTKNGTTCTTSATETVLKWDQGKYTHTIPINPPNNCFTFRSNIGVKNYFAHTVKFEKTNHIWENECTLLCQRAHPAHRQQFPIKEDDPSHLDDAYDQEENVMEIPVPEEHKQNEFCVPEGEQHIPVGQEEEKILGSTAQAELMRWHYRLGHLSWKKIEILALIGVLPRYLAKVPSPVCAGCIFGDMCKRPWRTKPHKGQNKVNKITKAGQCVSVDQMEVSEQGFIAQLKGKLTRQRYTCATIFVDQYSDFSYVHLQRSMSSNKTVQAKESFEAKAREMGADILHYHADNGRFADNLFMEHVRKSGQTISFCAVGAHFQNGRAEKKIKNLRATARKMLLHAMSRWSDTITINLWPYALRTACDQMNMIPKDIQGITRIEMFSGVPVTTRLKNFNTWGCPVYALHSKLQGNISGVPKWNPRARLGINLEFLHVMIAQLV